MHTLAICGQAIKDLNRDNPTIGSLEIYDMAVTVGIMVLAEPEFEPSSPEHRTSVLLETAAFSCNYRDKALILRAAKNLPPDRFYSIGSEFVATVVGVGDDVDTLDVGDRVIPDGAWPGPDGVSGGLPTNNGSRGSQILDHRKLVAIPESMSDEVAAAFTIGAQTSYSIIRRLELDAQSSVLVTAARSNTSIFAIQAMASIGCDVYATTTSDDFASELAALGVGELFVVDPSLPTFMEHDGIREVASRLRGFDAVIDPFFDAHLTKVTSVMAMGGRYITCGLVDQHSRFTGEPVPGLPPADLNAVMAAALPLNLQLMGNCLGTRDDLQRAVDDFAAGRLDVEIDSTYSGGEAVGFLDRSYNAPDRLGKVVYLHDTT